MTTPVNILPRRSLDAPDGKILDGAIDVTAYSTTVVHDDGSQEIMLGFTPSEHVVRLAVHKDDLPTVMRETVGDYVIYEFCPQQHELTIAIEPSDVEGRGHLLDALAGISEDLSLLDDETAA